MAGIEMRAAAGRVTLSLMGDVGFEITASGVQRALAEAGGQPLTIQLHSYGGDAAQGIAIHNMLARHPGEKTIVIEGLAASAGSLIAMAGDRIVMPENAFLMIHNAWTMAAGDADAMRSTAEVLDMISAAYRRTYASRTGRDEEEIARLMDEETWLTADRAVELGFATEMSAPADIRADARRLERFTKVPAALLARETNPEPAAPAHPEEVRMDNPTTSGADHTALPAASVPPTPAAPQRVVATLPELRALAARSGLGAEFALAQLEAGATLAEAQSAAIDAMAAAAPAAVVRPTVQVTQDEGDTFRARVSDAIAARMCGVAPSESEREFALMGPLTLAREVLARRGVRNVHRLSSEDVTHRVLASGEHTTSDFAGILTNSTNKSLRTMFAAYPNTWSAWCDEIDVADFKQITAASIGQFPEPEQFAESATVPSRTVGEDFETYAVVERGVLISLSFPAIINDDLRAFQQVVRSAALGAYTALRRRVFGILTANGVMRDGVALFASGRNNLGTAGNLSAANLRQLYQLLAEQTTIMRAQPAATGGLSGAPLPPPVSCVLLVSPAEYITALELLTPMIVPTAVGSALPAEIRGMIQPVQEAFLNTGSQPYYLARTEAGMRPMEIAYLQGRRAPSVTSAERIEQTGITYRVLFPFNAAPVSARSIAANLG